MVSFISTLSLFILVLANGYFTFPAHDEKNWSSTVSPSFHGFADETTVSPKHLREVSNDSDKNEFLPEHPTHPSPFKVMGSEMAFTTERLPEENAFHELRALNNKDHLESSTFTTEASSVEERDLHESSTLTSEPSHMHMHESDLHESSTFTTESSRMHAREAGFDGEDGKDKREVGLDNDHHHSHADIHLDGNEQVENRREEKTNQQPMQIESTTLFMASFPSTSSTVAPQFDLSTKKYPGLLHDDQDNEGDKPVPKVPETSDDSLATTYPTPQLDQEGLKSLTNVPNDVLNLDHSNSYVVTDIASTVRATTMENKDQDQEQPTPKPSTKGTKNRQ